MKKWFGMLVALLVMTGCQPVKQNDVKETTVQQTTVAQTSQAVKEETTAQTSSVTKPEAAETIEVGITIKVDDKVVRQEEKIQTKTDVALLDIMKETFKVEDKDTMVTSIDGHSQDEKENRWWLFTVNGEMAEVGAADLYLEDGDQVEWTLSKL